MNDKETFSALMKQFGVPFTLSEDGSTLFIEEGTANVGGYCGFYCYYEFTPEGKFVKMSILE